MIYNQLLHNLTARCVGKLTPFVFWSYHQQHLILPSFFLYYKRWEQLFLITFPCFIIVQTLTCFPCGESLSTELLQYGSCSVTLIIFAIFLWTLWDPFWGGNSKSFQSSTWEYTMDLHREIIMLSIILLIICNTCFMNCYRAVSWCFHGSTSWALIFRLDTAVVCMNLKICFLAYLLNFTCNELYMSFCHLDTKYH